MFRKQISFIATFSVLVENKPFQSFCVQCGLSIFVGFFCFYFHLQWLPLCCSSVSTQACRAAVRTILLSLHPGSVLLLHFNVTLWISLPHFASGTLQFHSTLSSPNPSQRKALVSSSGLWLTSIFTPWGWPVSLCVMVGQPLPKPNVRLSCDTQQPLKFSWTLPRISRTFLCWKYCDPLSKLSYAVLGVKETLNMVFQASLIKCLWMLILVKDKNLGSFKFS